MKNNRNNFKSILISFIVIIVTIILFLSLNKVRSNSINANDKDKNTISTEELDKNTEKTSEGTPSTILDKSEEKVASIDNKDIKEDEKDKALEVINSKEAITVFVEAANFGSTVEILIDSSAFNTNYKYYQFFLGNKPISNIEDVTKSGTTIFPAQEAGSEVTLKLLNENNKALKELKIKLKDKK